MLLLATVLLGFCGDCNDDAVMDVQDAVCLIQEGNIAGARRVLEHLFLGQPMIKITRNNWPKTLVAHDAILLSSEKNCKDDPKYEAVIDFPFPSTVAVFSSAWGLCSCPDAYFDLHDNRFNLYSAAGCLYEHKYYVEADQCDCARQQFYQCRPGGLLGCHDTSCGNIGVHASGCTSYPNNHHWFSWSGAPFRALVWHQDEDGDLAEYEVMSITFDCR